MRLIPSLRPFSMRCVSAIRTMLAVALFTGVSAAHAQMIDIMKIDDARYYLLGSVGFAEFDYAQSDISDADSITPDDSDVTLRGGLGVRVSDVSFIEIALSDLGSPVQVENIASVLTSKVDTDLEEVFEFSVVTQFDTGSSFKPIGRLGFFSFDGEKNSDEDLLIGLGLQRENIRFEIQRYDFDVAPINTVSFTYMVPFSD